MKLRHDPRLLYRGISTWPPRWVADFGENPIAGEVSGVLMQIKEVPDYDKCFLYISQDDKAYVGCLLFNDVESCKSVTNLLKRNIGKPIARIGDLEVADKPRM